MTKPVPPAQKQVTTPKVKPTDAWSTLATAVNNSRNVGELLKKAELSDWDPRLEPMALLTDVGVCIECERPKGQKHTSACSVGKAETDPEADGKVTDDHTTDVIEAPGAWGLARTTPEGFTEYLGGLTTRFYTPMPIEKRASILTEIVKQSKAKFGPAGPLWNNTASFATVRLPELIAVGKSDELEMRIVLVNSLLPGKPSEIRFEPVRLACNTIQHFAADRLTLNSADDADARLTEASEALDGAVRHAARVGEVASAMRAKKLSVAEFEKVCDQIWAKPADTANGSVRELYEKRQGALKIMFRGEVDQFAGIGGTRYGGLQAILTAIEHNVAARTDQTVDDLKYRADDVLFGRLGKLARTAVELLEVPAA
jgi:hypothetical protein